MSFAAPWALLGLALVPLVALAFWARERGRRRVAARFARAPLLPGIAPRPPRARRWLPLAVLLAALAARHDVLALEIRDPREQELPNVGELFLVDPETGRQLRVDTRDRRLRERFAAAAAEERTGLARTLASLGVRHHVLTTSGDWLRSLAVFLKRSRS